MTVRRFFPRLLLVTALLAGSLGSFGYFSLEASLPQVDGEVALEGLAAPVMVERDAAGVPTIRGDDRLDVARALGFVHAQERFFQMDLLRRRPAGFRRGACARPRLAGSMRRRSDPVAIGCG